MAEDVRTFDYVAVDAGGKRVKGSVSARDDAGAFERLKRDGLAPLKLTPARGGASASPTGGKAGTKNLSDSESAEFLADFALLLRAGSDMRAALSILGARGRPAIKSIARSLSAEISGGGAMDQAFARFFPKKLAFVSALVAAGEASGDLAGGLERAGQMLEARANLREQLVSILSYPTFVLISTVAAVVVILLFVVPSVAPLAEAPGSTPGVAMRILLAASDLLSSYIVELVVFLGIMTAGLFVAVRAGLMTAFFERLMLDGPLGRTVRQLTYGSFSIALGNMLAAGAPMSDALRLAIRSVRSETARTRLEPVAVSVRQGQMLSAALDRVSGFPDTIARLSAIGEASGSLGAMLARAGKLEEQAAIRRIEAGGRLLGPMLIVVLGGLVGLLMAGLLSGVSGLGDAALQ
jgi:type II secretory pathway component PulF